MGWMESVNCQQWVTWADHQEKSLDSHGHVLQQILKCQSGIVYIAQDKSICKVFTFSSLKGQYGPECLNLPNIPLCYIYNAKAIKTRAVQLICLRYILCWVPLLPAEKEMALYRYSHLGVPTLRFSFHEKLVTRDHITCLRSDTPKRPCRALSVSLLLIHSHWPFCAARTERWLSCVQGSVATNPPSSEERYGRAGCVHSVGWLWLHRRQTNVVAWQGNWEALLSEQGV